MRLFADITVSELFSCSLIYREKGSVYTEPRRRYYGLTLCESGRIVYYQGNRVFVSEPGRVLIFPKDASYRLECEEAGSFPVVNFRCEGFRTDEFIEVDVPDQKELLYLFSRLMEVHNSRLPERHTKEMSLLYELLSRLESADAAQEESVLLGPALRYMEEHFTDPGLNNAVLAAQANISEVYFRRLFARARGITPKKYILELRITRAKQLLVGKYPSIASVAEQCGFSSVYHFCRTFHEYVGCTPTEYMKSNRMKGI